LHQAALAHKKTAPDDSAVFPSGFYAPYALAAQTVFLLCSALRDRLHVQCGDSGLRQLTYRLKTPASIADKLRGRGLPVTAASAGASLHDIAGVRVVLESVAQVDRFAQLLRQSPVIEIVSERDYIRFPKKSGYQSLHLLTRVPVVFGRETQVLPVEVQLRTTGMDIWASIEHDAIYKPIKS